MTVVDLGPLTVAAYAKDAAATDRGSDGLSLSFPLLGLYGETGSLLSVVKKKQRDSASFLGYAEAVSEELGDVLWYLATVARRGGICLSAIATATLVSGYSDWGRQDLAVTFEALQPDLIKHDGEPTPAFEGTLLQLAGEVGALLTDHQAGILEGDQNALATHLVKVLKRLVRAADEARTTLEAAAIKNLHKIFDRWPTERTYLAPFDQGSDPDEQLPRQSLRPPAVQRDLRRRPSHRQRGRARRLPLPRRVSPGLCRRAWMVPRDPGAVEAQTQRRAGCR
jgi:NTP pyrophosphatase (non-canonical NTP hydrolase)